MLKLLLHLCAIAIRKFFAVGGLSALQAAVETRLDDLTRSVERIEASLTDRTSDLANWPAEALIGAAQKCWAVPDKHLAETAAALALYYETSAQSFLDHPDRFRGLFDPPFLRDDGSLAYSQQAGVYTPGGEAPVDVDAPRHPLLGLLRDPETAVFLVLGQSNAANHGDIPARTEQMNYALNFLDMSVTRANDPLPGCSGTGGSIWSRLGDRLLEEGLFRRVLFIPVSFGGTFVKDWTPDGAMDRRLALALSRLYQVAGHTPLPVTAVFWMQGEAEANLTTMSSGEYCGLLERVVARLRERCVFAPVFVAQTTHCDVPESGTNHPEIRKGQVAATKPDRGVLPGPDTDTVAMAGDRHDGCHLSGLGMDKCAEKWLDAIRTHRPLLFKI